MNIHAKTALLGQNWHEDVRIVCRGGKIERVERDKPVGNDDVSVDVLLPALGNLHSHTFQRAMAGMTEFRSQGRESFWTWRDLMYRFLAQLSPEHCEAIAAMVFVEMLEAGYASVGEFHYVHHQPDGTPYAELGELSNRVIAAAGATGIGLTHLPVLYTYGGVDQEPLAGGQLRFFNDPNRFLDLHDHCKAALAELPEDACLGVAPHSLRASSPEDLTDVLNAVRTGPVHIHISEQQKEVADVEAKFGQRPVAWLLDSYDVDARWCLIHATHMTNDETVAMAKSGAVAGLCPITEANLGDGTFNGPAFLTNGGSFGVGSDSNIRISLVENCAHLNTRSGCAIWNATCLLHRKDRPEQLCTSVRRKAVHRLWARDAGEIARDKLADLVAIDRTHPSLCALSNDQLLDGLCFAAPDNIVTDTWAAGRHVVKNGQHVAREDIVRTYKWRLTQIMELI